MLDFSESSSADRAGPVHEHSIKQDLRRENSKLAQTNRDLTAQLSALRQQFNQALSVSSNIEKMMSQSAETGKEVAQLKAERDDVSRRLQIALQANQELKQTIEELKRGTDVPVSFRQQREKTEATLRGLGNDLASERQQKEKFKAEYLELESQVQNLLHAAGHYFGLVIDNQQTLLDCFLQGKARTVDAECGHRREEQVRALARKLRKNRKEIAEYRNLQMQADAQLDAIKCQLEAKQQEFARQFEELELKNRDQAAQIHGLVQEKDELLKEIAEKTSKIRVSAFQDEENHIRENEKLTKELSEVSEKLSACANVNAELKRKNDKAKLRAKSLEKKCRAFESAIRSMQEDKAENQCERDRDTAAVADAARRIRELEALADLNRDDMASKRNEIEKLAGTVANLESALKDSGREIDELRRQKIAQTEKEEKCKARIEQLKNEQTEKEKTIEELRARLKDALKPLDMLEILPVSCWTSSELPSELNEAVKDVARNTGFPVTTKIQMAFDTICRWFKVRQAGVEHELTTKNEAHTTLSGRADSLVSALRKAMPEVKINFDLLLSDEVTRSLFVDAISALKNSLDAKTSQSQLLESQLFDVLTALSVSTAEEATTSIHRLYQKVNSLRNKAKNYKAKRGEIYSALSQAEQKVKEADDHIAILEQEKDDLRAEITSAQTSLEQTKAELVTSQGNLAKEKAQRESLEENIAALNEQILRLRRSKEKLNNQLRSVRSMLDDLEKTHKERMRAEKERSQARHDQLNEQFRQQTTALQNSVREQAEKVAKSESLNTELESKNSELVWRAQKLETRVNAIQSECDREKKAMEAQNHARLLSLQTEYGGQLENVRAEGIAIRNRLIDAISRNFDKFTEDMRITESNFETALQFIRKKIDLLNTREAHFRSLLGLDPSQSLEEAIMRLAQSARRTRLNQL
jgi:chromosome segregation ATPase